jgi:thiol-disulfide isomerase/thioredoxin
MDGFLVVVIVLALAGAFGIYRQQTEGKVKVVEPTAAPTRIDHGIGELGERGTILQFSSAFCQPCKAAKIISKDIANIVPGVKHIDIDAESNLELVRTFNVMRTPTIFVLNKDGQVSAKISGVPRKEELLIALDDRAAENL